MKCLRSVVILSLVILSSVSSADARILDVLKNVTKTTVDVVLAVPKAIVHTLEGNHQPPKNETAIKNQDSANSTDTQKQISEKETAKQEQVSEKENEKQQPAAVNKTDKITFTVIGGGSKEKSYGIRDMLAPVVF